MKVCLISSVWEPVYRDTQGGIEAFIFMLAEGLQKLGVDVSVVAPGNSQLPMGTTLIPSCEVAVSTEKVDIDRFSQAVCIEETSALLALECNADIIHSNTHRPASALSLANVKAAATLHNAYTDIDRNYLLRLGLPYVHISKWNKQCTAIAGTVIHNGLDFTHVPCKTQHDLNAPLVFLGRIARHKGVDRAVKIAQMSGRDLVIAGPITHDDYFQDEIKPHLGSQISYVGSLGFRDKFQLLLSAYAAVLPARWGEPFGFTTLEALATGTPVLGTSYGAFPEMVLPGLGWCIRFDLKQDGLAVAATDDKVALALASQALCDHTSLLAPSSIRQSVEDRFSASRMAKNYLNHYQEILAR